jgi:hypothetical protein
MDLGVPRVFGFWYGWCSVMEMHFLKTRPSTPFLSIAGSIVCLRFDKDLAGELLILYCLCECIWTRVFSKWREFGLKWLFLVIQGILYVKVSSRTSEPLHLLALLCGGTLMTGVSMSFIKYYLVMKENLVAAP